MSLVGTRPPTQEEVRLYEARHRMRLATKPGITGMWQVNGLSNVLDFEEVVRLDASYINEWSIKDNSQSCFHSLLCFSICMPVYLSTQEKAGRVP